MTWTASAATWVLAYRNGPNAMPSLRRFRPIVSASQSRMDTPLAASAYPPTRMVFGSTTSTRGPLVAALENANERSGGHRICRPIRAGPQLLGAGNNPSRKSWRKASGGGDSPDSSCVGNNVHFRWNFACSAIRNLPTMMSGSVGLHPHAKSYAASPKRRRRGW